MSASSFSPYWDRFPLLSPECDQHAGSTGDAALVRIAAAQRLSVAKANPRPENQAEAIAEHLK